MRFKAALSEGIFLKRSFQFLVEAAIPNQRTKMLYCPNLGSLPEVEVLGSRLWFSPAQCLSRGYLDILELVEVDGGEKVVINSEYTNALIREEIHQNKITELEGYRFLYQPTPGISHHTLDFLLREQGEQCFLHIEPIFYANQEGIAGMTEIARIKKIVQELLFQKRRGIKAVFILCAMHTGLKAIKMDSTSTSAKDHFDAIQAPFFNNLNPSRDVSQASFLMEAKYQGLEILAFGIEVNLQEIKLGKRIPIFVSEELSL